jgi:cytochrome c553
VSCHGANFSKPIAPNYPKIAGQHSDYLFVALKAYKTDNNAAVGRNNGVMGDARDDRSGRAPAVSTPAHAPAYSCQRPTILRRDDP